MVKITIPHEVGQTIDEGLAVITWPDPSGPQFLPQITIHPLPVEFHQLQYQGYAVVPLLYRPQLVKPLLKFMDQYLEAPPVTVNDTHVSAGSDDELAAKLQYLTLLSSRKLGAALKQRPQNKIRPAATNNRNPHYPSPAVIGVFGPTGIGKSHLMYMAAAQIRRRYPHSRVVYSPHNITPSQPTEDLIRWVDEIEATFHLDLPIVRHCMRLRRLVGLGSQGDLLYECLGEFLEAIVTYSQTKRLVPVWVYDQCDQWPIGLGEYRRFALQYLARTLGGGVTIVAGHQEPVETLSCSVQYDIPEADYGFTLAEARLWWQMYRTTLAVHWAGFGPTREQWQLMEDRVRLVPGEITRILQHLEMAGSAAPADAGGSNVANTIITATTIKSHGQFTAWLDQYFKRHTQALIQKHGAHTRCLSEEERLQLRALILEEPYNWITPLSGRILNLGLMYMAGDRKSPLTTLSERPPTLRYLHPLAKRAIGQAERSHKHAGLAEVALQVMKHDFLTTTKGTVSEKYVLARLRETRAYDLMCIQLLGSSGFMGRQSTVFAATDCDIRTLNGPEDLHLSDPARPSKVSRTGSIIYLPQRANFPKFDWVIWHQPTRQLLLCQMKAGKEVARYINTLVHADLEPWATAAGLKVSQVVVVWVVARDVYSALRCRRFHFKSERVPLEQQWVMSFQDNPHWPGLRSFDRFE
ncbi:hypothetical protein BJ085DRAFT_39821 [Dimargaris cristalligena]|uniref:Uncharacterized protein n=1 Tax=Dimargaris cristalligena TaxID=215637 RepID=A0A4P9ZJM6_9FUNG|nr:hypothetical protein BJ085DRAFT_39821 [Dimargaris cristalligena]|eukprot:RKP33238.1 hypothetical protein BJ085DRAFT_39821 [Dimargaris cristalligena]